MIIIFFLDKIALAGLNNFKVRGEFILPYLHKRWQLIWHKASKHYFYDPATTEILRLKFLCFSSFFFRFLSFFFFFELLSLNKGLNITELGWILLWIQQCKVKKNILLFLKSISCCDKTLLQMFHLLHNFSLFLFYFGIFTRVLCFL